VVELVVVGGIASAPDANAALAMRSPATPSRARAGLRRKNKSPLFITPPTDRLVSIQNAAGAATPN